jgi:hypothetical protein
MARFRNLRPGPVAMTVALYNVWKGLTPQQRRQVMAVVRRHGPTVARKAAELRRRRGSR